jgi:hypothetical protein
VPVASADTSAFAPTSSHVIISTGPISLDYDPSNLNPYPPFISVYLDDYTTTRQRFYYAKVYYTIP